MKPTGPILAFLFCNILFCNFTYDEPVRYYMVPEENLRRMDSQERPSVESTRDGLSLVRMTERQMKHLSKKLHQEKSICGGFVDIDHDVSQGTSTAHSVFQQKAARMIQTRDAQTAYIAPFDKVNPAYPTQVATILGQVTAAHFQSFLTEISSMNDRYSKGPGGINAVTLVKNKMLQMAQQKGKTNVSAWQVPSGGVYVMDSLVVKVEGTQPSLPAVVVGGHLDTFGSNKPGADDDGSGSSTVFEIFSGLMNTNLRLKRTVYFIFYAAEEMGLIGSQRVVADFQSRGISVYAVTQFDMTGFKSSRDSQEIYFITDYTSTAVTSFLKKLTETYVGIAATMIGNTRCGYACSDHAPWTNSGFPAGFPSEASFDNMNGTLHTSQDTMSLLSMNHAMKFVKLGASFIVEAGDPDSAASPSPTPSPSPGSSPAPTPAPIVKKKGTSKLSSKSPDGGQGQGCAALSVAPSNTSGTPPIVGAALLVFPLFLVLETRRRQRLS